MEILSYILEQGLILIPALYIIGKIICATKRIPRKYIPILLLPAGIAGAVALMGFSAQSVIQGILITGAAVYGDQICKQLQKPE